MKRFLDIFGAKALTPLLALPPAVTFLVYLMATGRQTIMLSQGIDVLSGGVDVPGLIARGSWWGVYAVVLVAHVLARLVRTSIVQAAVPDPREVDAEHILARAGFYTVVVPPEDWVACASQAIPGSWYVADDEGTRAVFWSGPKPWLRQLWRYALWLVLAGMFLSFFTRVGTYERIGDGEALAPPRDAELYRYDWRFPLPAARVTHGVDVFGVVDGSVAPALDPSGLFVPKGYLLRPVTADVVYGRADSAAKRTAMWPPRIFGTKFISIVDMGLAPHMVVVRDGEVIVDTYTKSIISPGLSDTGMLSLEGVPFLVEIAAPSGVLPVPYAEFRVRAVKEGAAKVTSESVLASGVVSPVQSLEVGEYALSIPESRWWVGLSVTSDPGLWVVVVGLIILTVALGVRFWVSVVGSQRFEMVVVQTEQGARLYVGADASWFARRRAERSLRAVAQAMAEED